jgi:hypothetical protein
MDIVPRVFLSASLSRCLPGASSDNLATLSRLNDLASGDPLHNLPALPRSRACAYGLMSRFDRSLPWQGNEHDSSSSQGF